MFMGEHVTGSEIREKPPEILETSSKLKIMAGFSISKRVIAGFLIHPSTVTVSRWWFQIFFIFTHTWGNDPI